MRSTLALVAAASLVSLLGGCYQHRGGYFSSTPGNPGRPAIGYEPGPDAMGWEAMPEESDDADEETVILIDRRQLARAAYAPHYHVEWREARRFDATAARTALGMTDVSGCRNLGAQGYGHAKATFNADGRISKVVIDEPRGLTRSAVKCIGDRLGKATMPEFDGSLVTVGTTWYVPE
ncbi:hypothetical protein AKJ09_08182 [Labilithrix luteola]|uniref:Lipoprotein n=1 Tax=Labilithrix luteola TaxID=1391654 RepID=A0A0K1Q722_9BACT|nr:hypothetical protein [Labilithrix luteola]AKV01519.1 hypothetical protein AKJ09_08182 [Labilithrix luteola]